MPNELLASLRLLSDHDLVAHLLSLVGRARHVTVLIVAHLAELDTRDIYLREGHSSLFAYCCSVLRLSEHEAYNRIEAARAARRFPLILDLLAEGAVNLTTVRLLAPHLTAENHRSVLDSARGKRKVEVEEIVARVAPRPDVAPSIRKVGAPKPEPSGKPASAGPTGFLDAVITSVSAPTGPAIPSRPAALRPAIAPLSPDRYRIQLTIGGETLEKLRRAQDLLRHAVPSGEEAVVIDRALTALLADLDRKKLAATDRPRPLRRTKLGSRHMPATVTRTVWRRDESRCAYVGPNGQRCPERAFLELHHKSPYAVGGGPTVENVELRCRRHNGYEARVYFGPLREYLATGSRPGSSSSAPARGELVLERVETKRPRGPHVGAG
jgi:hypothetical protein